MKKKIRIRLLVVILLLALLIGMIGLASAKYTQTISINGKITFSARLADSIAVQEHKAVRQADGTYVLHDGSTKPGSEETYPNEIVNSNAYTLIPGVYIPKDPHIVISGKTPIEAYLYIEIVDKLDTVTIDGKSVKLIDYSVENCWEESAAFAAKHGGKVYVYTGSDNTPYKLNSTPADPIYILENNQVTVSQYVKSYNITADSDQDTLSFYAYLVETASNN